MIGLLFAIPFGLASVAFVQADTLPASVGSMDKDCQSCHTAVHNAWMNSAHGHATTDPSFQKSWEALGEPRECLACHTTGYDPETDTWVAEGINCAACHSPIEQNHPDVPMPTDQSANLCGTCHTETLFEWQVSKHRSTNLTCVGCHGQHSTTLRDEDASALCSSCHRERASNFAHTAHSQEGLTCADCHLGPLNGELGEGHAVRDHSFQVKLSTCNECHAYQMHDPVEVHTDKLVTESPETLASYETFGVSVEPDPVSPLGFAMLSGLFGLAIGMIAAPWLERGYRYFSGNDKDE
jgi:hypothetical protein